PPAGSVPIEQVITAPPPHEPWVVPTETKVNPGGSASETVTPLACPGPLLVTRSSNRTPAPTATLEGVADFVIERSTEVEGGAGAVVVVVGVVVVVVVAVVVVGVVGVGVVGVVVVGVVVVGGGS